MTPHGSGCEFLVQLRNARADAEAAPNERAHGALTKRPAYVQVLVSLQVEKAPYMYWSGPVCEICRVSENRSKELCDM